MDVFEVWMSEYFVIIIAEAFIDTVITQSLLWHWLKQSRSKIRQFWLFLPRNVAAIPSLAFLDKINQMSKVPPVPTSSNLRRVIRSLRRKAFFKQRSPLLTQINVSFATFCEVIEQNVSFINNKDVLHTDAIEYQIAFVDLTQCYNHLSYQAFELGLCEGFVLEVSFETAASVIFSDAVNAGSGRHAFYEDRNVRRQNFLQALSFTQNLFKEHLVLPDQLLLIYFNSIQFFLFFFEEAKPFLLGFPLILLLSRHNGVILFLANEVNRCIQLIKMFLLFMHIELLKLILQSDQIQCQNFFFFISSYTFHIFIQEWFFYIDHFDAWIQLHQLFLYLFTHRKIIDQNGLRITYQHEFRRVK